MFARAKREREAAPPHPATWAGGRQSSVAAGALCHQRDMNSQKSCPRSCTKSTLEQEPELRFSRSIYFSGHWTSWGDTAPLKVWTNISRTWFSLCIKVSFVSSSSLLWICPVCTYICMTVPSDQQGLKRGPALCQGG